MDRDEVPAVGRQPDHGPLARDDVGRGARHRLGHVPDVQAAGDLPGDREDAAERHRCGLGLGAFELQRTMLCPHLDAGVVQLLREQLQLGGAVHPDQVAVGGLVAETLERLVASVDDHVDRHAPGVSVDVELLLALGEQFGELRVVELGGVEEGDGLRPPI